MSYQVNWQDEAAEQKRSRKIVSEAEARGFVKGLRVCSGHKKVELWKLEANGQRTSLPIRSEQEEHTVLAFPPAAN